jgi:phage terminase large subunit-like protein
VVEFIGPCKFSHWDENGDPVGKPNPTAWVQIAAVNAEQTKNTMLLIPTLMPNRTRLHFNLEVQKQIIAVKGRPDQRIETVSASYRSMEGNRPSFCVLNETHHWTESRGGPDLYFTIRNNVDKQDGRYLCITNAHLPGEGSVAEQIRDAVDREREGLAEDSGWFFCSLEANAAAPLTKDWAPFIVETIRGDAVWLNTEVIVQSLQDTSVPPSRQRRMWYNQVVASEDAIFSEAEWDAVALWDSDENGFRKAFNLQPGDSIVMGFDGGKTDDATALIAIRISDRMAFPIHIWQKPEGPMGDNWRIDDREVDSMVHWAFRNFDVKAFYADMALWESWIESWSDQYRELLLVKPQTRSAIGYDMRGSHEKTTRFNEALIQNVLDRKIFHDGDPLFRRHALNAKRRENKWGLTFGKESRLSDQKIDAYAAFLLAFIALNELAERGKKAPIKYDSTLFQF